MKENKQSILRLLILATGNMGRMQRKRVLRKKAIVIRSNKFHELKKGQRREESIQSPIGQITPQVTPQVTFPGEVWLVPCTQRKVE